MQEINILDCSKRQKNNIFYYEILKITEKYYLGNDFYYQPNSNSN